MSEDVIDLGHDIIATSWDMRGLHLLQPELQEWRPPAVRPVLGAEPIRPEHDTRPRDPDFVEEKFLVYPMPGEDRLPISIVKFPPNFVFPRHWHTDGEFLMVLDGEAHVAGQIARRGAMSYNDARTVYGTEAAGPEGCEFLMIRRCWAENHIVASEGGVVPHGVQDTGRDEIATTRAERGLHLFDPDATAWTMPVVRPVDGRDPMLPENDDRPLVAGAPWEKSLMYPLPGDDRFPISIIRFPPNYSFGRHWHTEGEFVMILSGTAELAGATVGPGAMAYNDARTVYGAEAAGPEGCDFLLIRRAWAQTHLVPTTS